MRIVYSKENDYYEILKISVNASSNEIKKAFKREAKKWHPDKKQGDQLYEARFKVINEAYEVLKNQKMRNRYDCLHPLAKNRILEKKVKQKKAQEKARSTFEKPVIHSILVKRRSNEENEISFKITGDNFNKRSKIEFKPNNYQSQKIIFKSKNQIETFVSKNYFVNQNEIKISIINPGNKSDEIAKIQTEKIQLTKSFTFESFPSIKFITPTKISLYSSLVRLTLQGENLKKDMEIVILEDCDIYVLGKQIVNSSQAVISLKISQNSSLGKKNIQLISDSYCLILKNAFELVEYKDIFSFYPKLLKVGEPLALTSKNSIIEGIAFDSQGELFAVSHSDSSICLWNFPQKRYSVIPVSYKYINIFFEPFKVFGKLNHKPETEKKLLSKCTCLEFHPHENELFIGCQNGDIFSFNIHLQEMTKIYNNKSKITNLKFDLFGKLLAIGNNQGVVTIYDLSSNKEILIENIGKGPIKWLEFSSIKRTLFIGLKNAEFFVINICERSIVKNRKLSIPFIKDACIHPYEDFIACAHSEKEIVIIDGNNLEETEILYCTKGKVGLLCFEQKGENLISCSDDGSILLWDWNSKSVKKQLFYKKGLLYDVINPIAAYPRILGIVISNYLFFLPMN